MKKLAVLLGLSGAFLTAQADMTETFDPWTMGSDCEADDLGPCMLFQYETKSVDFPAATTFGSGQVLQVNYDLAGAYSSAGVGIVFTTDWSVVDASALSAVKLKIRSDADHPDAIYRVTLKNSEDLEYEALGAKGLGYMTDIDVTAEGSTLTIPVDKFVMPVEWWFSDEDAMAWVGSTKPATKNGAGKDTAALNAGRRRVLSSLTSIQVSVGCGKEATCAITGFLEIDDVTLVGVVDADGYNLVDGEQTTVSVLPRKAVQGLRTAINGQLLTVGRPESSNASLDLIRLDGSKVASWNIAGSVASVALPNGLEKGTYYAVVNSAGKRHSTAVSIVR